MFNFKSLLFLLFFLASALLASSQERVVADTTTHHNLGEVVIDGQQIKRHRSAMPIQQYNEADIKQLNANNIADIAKHFAGVTVKDYGGIGGIKTVSVRGLGAAHTGVCYDGVMANDVQSGQIDVGRFSIENIAEVSLSNGQPNDFFQPARMFASSSVLSFSSMAYKNDSTNPFYGKATLKAGSFGLVNPSIILNKGFAKKWSATLTADGITANGEYKFDEDLNPGGSKPNIIEKTRTNGDVHSFKSEAQVVGYLKEFETLTFKTNYYYSERGLPGADVLYAANAEDRMLDKGSHAQLLYKNKQSCIFQYQGQASFNSAFMRYSEVNASINTLPNNTQINDYTQNEYYLSGTAQYFPINKIAVTGAIDWFYNDLISETNLYILYNASPVRQTYLANLAAKYFSQRLTVGANVLYTATYESSDKNAAPDRHKFSPTISFSYQLLSDTELRLRGYYKNIFRLPTFAELYYHNFGYSELRPEITNQYNLGLLYRANSLFFLSDFEFTLDGYYNEVKDKITILLKIPFSTVSNVGNVIIKGCDAGLKTRLPFNRVSGLLFNANYSYQLAQDRTSGNRRYGKQIPYTPVHSGSGSIAYYFSHLEFGYNLLYSGTRWSGQYDKQANPSMLKIYAEHSLYGKYSYKKAMLMAEAINLTDQQYDIVKDYPMPGINYRLTLSYTF